MFASRNNMDTDIIQYQSRDPFVRIITPLLKISFSFFKLFFPYSRIKSKLNLIERKLKCVQRLHPLPVKKKENYPYSLRVSSIFFLLQKSNRSLFISVVTNCNVSIWFDYGKGSPPEYNVHFVGRIMWNGSSTPNTRF